MISIIKDTLVEPVPETALNMTPPTEKINKAIDIIINGPTVSRIASGSLVKMESSISGKKRFTCMIKNMNNKLMPATFLMMGITSNWRSPPMALLTNVFVADENPQMGIIMII